MARKKTNPADAVLQDRDDVRHLLLIGGLVGAVLLTLVLGAALALDPGEAGPVAALEADGATGGLPPAHRAAAETDRAAAGAGPGAEPAPAPRVLEPADDGAAALAEPAAEEVDAADAPEPGGAVPLADRVRADVRRLAAHPDAWTLQFLVTREEARAEEIVARLADGDALHVLPVRVQGEDCFRICWGRFATREAALGATAPPELVALNADPIPRAVSGLVP